MICSRIQYHIILILWWWHIYSTIYTHCLSLCPEACVVSWGALNTTVIQHLIYPSLTKTLCMPSAPHWLRKIKPLSHAVITTPEKICPFFILRPCKSIKISGSKFVICISPYKSREIRKQWVSCTWDSRQSLWDGKFLPNSISDFKFDPQHVSKLDQHTHLRKNRSFVS